MSGTVPNIGMIAGETTYPPRHGNAVHIYQLWHRLRRMGYEVHTWGEQAIPSRIEHPRTEEGLTDLLRDLDLLYVRFPVPYDVRLAHLVRLLRKRRLPTIWEFNAPLYEWTRECPPRTLWTVRYKAMLYTRNHLAVRSTADHAICVSNTMGDYAGRTFGLRQVSVIPNGGDPELFNPAERAQGRVALGIPDGELMVFWGGWTAMPWQGLKQLFEVARRLEHGGVRFVLAGDADHLPETRPDNMRILGEIDYFDMPRAIAAADVCLCLYRAYNWCPIGFYGSAIKLFDYMACGRAVIASAMGQICEVIQDGVNGLLTDGSHRDVIAKIRLLGENNALRESLGRAARETVVKEYNWQRVAERTSAIIQELFRDNSGPGRKRCTARRGTKSAQ